MTLARLAGSGANLSEASGGTAVWGMKGLVRAFARRVYHVVLRQFEEGLDRETDELDLLLEALRCLATRLGVDERTLEELTSRRLDDPVFWRSIDRQQRVAFLTNDLFDALDLTRLELANAAVGLAHYLAGRPPPAPTLPVLRGQLGFLFRAREYARVYSDLVANGGYENVVRRASRALSRRFEETNGAVEREERAPATPADPALEEALAGLRAPGSEERLRAIGALEKLGNAAAVEPLKLLLNDPDERVRNRALDAILALCGEPDASAA
ncbi:MAG: hypothetical protein Kow0069_03830 [Promethearchaeota archaeon]